MDSLEPTDTPPDFAKIVSNAKREGIPLSEIAIVYKNLNDAEKAELEARGLNAGIMTADLYYGRFDHDETVFFPSKAHIVLYLPA